MKETFTTRAEAVARRNQLLDATLFTQVPTFFARYSHDAWLAATRYRQDLYAAVDAVTEWPAEIDWPELPHLETCAERDAKLPPPVKPEV